MQVENGKCFQVFSFEIPVFVFPVAAAISELLKFPGKLSFISIESEALRCLVDHQSRRMSPLDGIVEELNLSLKKSRYVQNWAHLRLAFFPVLLL